MRLTLLLTPTLATAYQLFGAAHTPCLRAEPCLRVDAVRCIASIDKPAVVNLPAEPFVPAARLQGSDKPTVWGEFGALAVESVKVRALHFLAFVHRSAKTFGGVWWWWWWQQLRITRRQASQNLGKYI